MNWAEAIWVNNKIRIPDRKKRLVAIKDTVIKAIYGTKPSGKGKAFAFSFTPAYSGTVYIGGVRVHSTSSSAQFSSGIESISTSSLSPYTTPATMDANEYVEHRYYAIQVIANQTIVGTYTVYENVGTGETEANTPIMICGAVVENALVE